MYISKDYARAIANMHAVRLLLLATYLHVQIISLGLIRNLKLKASLFFCNADMFAQLVLMSSYCIEKNVIILYYYMIFQYFIQGVPKKTLLSEMGEVRIFLNTASCHMDKINRI